MDLGTKIIPSDEIRNGRFDIHKSRLSEFERTRAYDIEFRRLKNHTEISIADDVAFIDYNLTDDERALMIRMLTARVDAYRRRHPILFRKWIKSQDASKK